jgi:hypothetical protein
LLQELSDAADDLTLASPARRPGKRPSIPCILRARAARVR